MAQALLPLVASALAPGLIKSGISSTVDQVKDLYASGKDLIEGKTGVLETAGNVIKDTLGNTVNIVTNAVPGGGKIYNVNRASEYLPSPQTMAMQQTATPVTNQLVNNTENPAMRPQDRGISLVNMPQFKYGSELDLIDPQSVNLRRVMEQARAGIPTNVNTFANNFKVPTSFNVLPPEGLDILNPGMRGVAQLQKGIDAPVAVPEESDVGIENLVNKSKGFSGARIARKIAQKKKTKPKPRAVKSAEKSDKITIV